MALRSLAEIPEPEPEEGEERMHVWLRVVAEWFNCEIKLGGMGGGEFWVRVGNDSIVNAVATREWMQFVSAVARWLRSRPNLQTEAFKNLKWNEV